MFHFYTNAISQASKNVAKGIFIVGLLLIGFGILILAMPDLFAVLAALIFFIAGVGCAGTAIKIYLTQRRIDRFTSDGTNNYRKNVRIRFGEHYDE